MTAAAELLIEKEIRPAFWLYRPKEDHPAWALWRRLYGPKFIEAPRKKIDPAPRFDLSAPPRQRERLSFSGAGSRVPLAEEYYNPEYYRCFISHHRALCTRAMHFRYVSKKTALLRPKNKFMNKRMEPIEVSITDEKLIRLTSFGRDGADRQILLHPSQISLLCDWLQEAKETAEKASEA